MYMHVLAIFFSFFFGIAYGANTALPPFVAMKALEKVQACKVVPPDIEIVRKELEWVEQHGAPIASDVFRNEESSAKAEKMLEEAAEIYKGQYLPLKLQIYDTYWLPVMEQMRRNCESNDDSEAFIVTIRERQEYHRQFSKMAQHFPALNTAIDSNLYSRIEMIAGNGKELRDVQARLNRCYKYKQYGWGCMGAVHHPEVSAAFTTESFFWWFYPLRGEHRRSLAELRSLMRLNSEKAQASVERHIAILTYASEVCPAMSDDVDTEEKIISFVKEYALQKGLKELSAEALELEVRLSQIKERLLKREQQVIDFMTEKYRSENKAVKIRAVDQQDSHALVEDRVVNIGSMPKAKGPMHPKMLLYTVTHELGHVHTGPNDSQRVREMQADRHSARLSREACLGNIVLRSYYAAAAPTKSFEDIDKVYYAKDKAHPCLSEGIVYGAAYACKIWQIPLEECYAAVSEGFAFYDSIAISPDDLMSARKKIAKEKADAIKSLIAAVYDQEYVAGA